MSAHHSTSRHAHITTFGYKLHVALFHCTRMAFQTTPHIPHCISTVILYHTAMSNKVSNHSDHTTRYIPQPHFTSASQHTTIPRRTIFHNTISVTLPDITRSPYGTSVFYIALYSTSQPHWLGWIRHNIPHLALQNKIGPHHTMATTWLCDVWSGGIKCVECQMYGVLCRKCHGWMWNIFSLWWWDMECIDMWPLHHYHHILHCIFPHQTPSLTLFQATPHSTSHHHRFSPYRTFHIDTVPHTIPICNTI